MEVRKQVRTGHGTTDWEKECFKAVYRHPAYLTSMQSTSRETLGWRKHGLEEAQAGIKIARRNINNLRYSDETTFISENEKELEHLDESERGERKKLA